MQNHSYIDHAYGYNQRYNIYGTHGILCTYIHVADEWLKDNVVCIWAVTTYFMHLFEILFDLLIHKCSSIMYRVGMSQVFKSESNWSQIECLGLEAVMISRNSFALFLGKKKNASPRTLFKLFTLKTYWKVECRSWKLW